MRYKIYKKVIAALLLCAIMLSICAIPSESLKVEIPYPVFQRGMTYVTWSSEGFASIKSDESVKSMAECGVEFVAIVVTWYQEVFNSTDIMRTGRTPSDSSLRHAVRKAHAHGMKVMLKPHIDLIRDEGNYRADIGFGSEKKWEEWFENYSKFINFYARLAEEEGVELLCIGTELSFAATKKDFWENVVIPGVRKNFSGRITYAANWDDYKEIGFWEKLDYAGIDAYFPLSANANPTLDDLKEGWKIWLRDIEVWHNRIKKPVIFTECGYPSTNGAAAKPWEEVMIGQPNMNIQADCYRAVFETFWGKEWFSGVYWWNWNTYPLSGGGKDKRFTPQNKLAAAEIKSWYGKLQDERPAFIQLNGMDTEWDERLKLEDIKQKERRMAERIGIKITGEMAGGKERFEASHRP